jgi:hypothetical protein
MWWFRQRRILFEPWVRQWDQQPAGVNHTYNDATVFGLAHYAGEPTAHFATCATLKATARFATCATLKPAAHFAACATLKPAANHAAGYAGPEERQAWHSL